MEGSGIFLKFGGNTGIKEPLATPGRQRSAPRGPRNPAGIREPPIPGNPWSVLPAAGPSVSPTKEPPARGGRERRRYPSSGSFGVPWFRGDEPPFRGSVPVLRVSSPGLPVAFSTPEAGGRWAEKVFESDKAAEGALENWILGTSSSRLHPDRSV